MSLPTHEQPRQPPADLMENVEAVDVSWLHHSSKVDALTRTRSASSAAPPQHLQQLAQQPAVTSSGRRASAQCNSLPVPTSNKSSASLSLPTAQDRKEEEHHHHHHHQHQHHTQGGLLPKRAAVAAPVPTNTSASAQSHSSTSPHSNNNSIDVPLINAHPPSATSSPTPSSRISPPPTTLSNTGFTRAANSSSSTSPKPVAAKSGRRGSWISSISSKFSSGTTPPDTHSIKKEEKEPRGGLRGLSLGRDRKKSEQDDRHVEVARSIRRGSSSESGTGNNDSHSTSSLASDARVNDATASLKAEVALNPFSAWGGFGEEVEIHPPAGPKDKETKDNTNANAHLSSDPQPVINRGNSPQRQSGFFRNAFRKLSAPQFSSSNPESAAAPQLVPSPQRRVMNVDRERDRVLVPELKMARLRRVAFCVDVEIAGISAKEECEGDSQSSLPKDKQFTVGKAMKESEGASLKAHPDASEKTADNIASEVKEKEDEKTGDKHPGRVNGKDKDKERDKSKGEKPHTKKQEKKKRSEEERKERKERKHRQAEMNGTIPLQFVRDALTSAPHARRDDQPTTDPVRIYRRCCSLRETGVLKRIVAEISASSSRLADEPGTVAFLDLTGFKMKTEDLITFSDWLAVVPVRKLILQDCGLTDETLRMILSALLATKPMNDVYQRRAPAAGGMSRKAMQERFGGIQKLILNDNRGIGVEGWRSISLFIHMSRTLVGIDLSGIPFPSRLQTKQDCTEVAKIFSCSLQTRLAGDHLMELVLSECNLSTEDVSAVCEAARLVGLRRLGLANNNLSRQALKAVVSYYLAGNCEGLDLGGNDLSLEEETDPDSPDPLDAYESSAELLSSTITSAHSLNALSLADCHLTPKMLDPLLRALATLPSFKFIDLSHNRALFSETPRSTDGDENMRPGPHTRHHGKTKHDAVTILRKYLPRMHDLRRIHLVDVSLSPDAAIALAEILPDCPRMCHINILENAEIAGLTAADKANDESCQESACALYASLMTAVRISNSLFAIDIEVPSVESNEVVKALAEQIVAYSLWNLERTDLVDNVVPQPSAEVSPGSLVTEVNTKKNVPIPDVLLHIVGAGDDDIGAEEIEPPPNEDYVITGTGVVKALGVFLGNLDHRRSRSISRRPLHRRGISSTSVANSITGSAISGPAANRMDSPVPSGLSTPQRRLSGKEDMAASTPKHRQKEAKNMSKNLLSSARTIRSRLQIALVRVDQAGDDATYRRLLFLDSTLERMIRRFEDEFPDCRLPAVTKKASSEASVTQNETANAPPTAGVEGIAEFEDAADNDPFAIRLSRTNSNTSLHSRWLTSEEGRMHRVSQHVRRDILGKSDSRTGASDSSDDETQKTTGESQASQGPNEDQLRSLREKIRRLSSPSRPGSRSSTPAPVRSPASSLKQGLASDDAPADSAVDPTRESKFSPKPTVPASVNSVSSSDTAPTLPEIDVGHIELDFGSSTDMPNASGDDQALEDSLAELMTLRRHDPESFERFRQSQIAAQINAGIGTESQSPPDEAP
ncbi:hypothetical protein KEM56_006863 [Ascosphaera pollenicola]|nr:hypothetical protein KEM56_006863 [Ascosphaera pollenicola]